MVMVKIRKSVTIKSPPIGGDGLFGLGPEARKSNCLGFGFF
jgi:hypothetical protein